MSSSLGSVANRLRHLERDGRGDDVVAGAARLTALLQAASNEELERLADAADAGVQAEMFAAIERRLDQERPPFASSSPFAVALAAERARRGLVLDEKTLVAVLTNDEVFALCEALKAGQPVPGGTRLEGEALDAARALIDRGRRRLARWSRSRSGLTTRHARAARASTLWNERRQAARLARQAEPLCGARAPGRGGPR